MKIQEKIDNYLKENENATEENVFEFLQTDEYPGAEIEDNGNSGQVFGKKWFTLKLDNLEEDFIF